MSRLRTMTAAFNAWATRAGLMNTIHARHVQLPDGRRYRVFLGSTQAQADRKRREYDWRTGRAS